MTFNDLQRSLQRIFTSRGLICLGNGRVFPAYIYSTWWSRDLEL